MQEQWKDHLESHDTEQVFLHRDEFYKTYGKHDAALPAIFLDCDGVAELFMGDSTINTCDSLDN